jgi:hypothetical protein
VLLSLYWAVLFRVEENLSSLVVFVVDFDELVAPYTDITPVVGPMMVQTAQSLLAPSGTVGWQNQPASGFNFEPMAVRQAIYDEKAWEAIIINQPRQPSSRMLSPTEILHTIQWA